MKTSDDHQAESELLRLVAVALLEQRTKHERRVHELEEVLLAVHTALKNSNMTDEFDARIYGWVIDVIANRL